MRYSHNLDNHPRVRKFVEHLYHIPIDINAFFNNAHFTSYIGWHGFDNLGDDALFEIFRDQTKPHMNVYSKISPGVILHEWLKRRSLKAAASGQYCILGGGTLINKSYFLKQLKNWNYRGTRYFSLGTGVADTTFWIDYIKHPDFSHDLNKQWIDQLGQFERVTVRGPHSQNLLSNTSNKSLIPPIVGDLGLLMSRPKLIRREPTKTIGVAVGYTQNILWGKNERAMFQLTTDCIQALLKDNWRVVLLPVNSADNRLSETIAKDLSHSSLSIHFTKSVDRYIELCGKCDVILAGKLHSAVFGACGISPIVMLEYRPKCKDFMSSLQLEHYSLRTDRLKKSLILDSIHEAYQDRTNLQHHIHTRASRFRLLLESELKHYFSANFNSEFNSDLDTMLNGSAEVQHGRVVAHGNG